MWYHANTNDSSFVTLEVMRAYGDHVLHLVREVASGAEEVTERMYRRVIAGYVPHGRQGFCVGDGALTSETSKNEQTLISFRRPRHGDFMLSLATNTVDQPEEGASLQDIHDEREILMESGSVVTILLNERRVVAGLGGVDARIQIRPRGEATFVRFTWRFGGIGGDALAPQLVLIGAAPLEHMVQLVADWEKLLQSLHPLPQPR